MKAKQCIRLAAQGLAAGVGLATASYAAYVAVTWARYGHVKRPSHPEDDYPLLDRFMPSYEVVERHKVRIAAPAEVTFSAACDMALKDSAVIRGIFRARELVLGSKPDDKTLPRGLLAQTKALGWGVLAEVSGREIVMGAVTQAWLADVVFRAMPPYEFAASAIRAMSKSPGRCVLIRLAHPNRPSSPRRALRPPIQPRAQSSGGTGRRPRRAFG